MSNRTRVLVVDDSALARMVISRRVSLDPGIEVVGVAVDGVDALEKVKSLRPDVVTLDVEMPRMDGLTTLSRVMAECPTAVVMLSRLTEEDAEVTIKALEAGAVDFFLKPSMVDKGGLSKAIAGLNDKIKMAAKVDISRVVRALRSGTPYCRGAESFCPSSAQGRWTPPAEECGYYWQLNRGTEGSVRDYPRFATRYRGVNTDCPAHADGIYKVAG